MKSRFPEIPWRQIVTMRNRLIHDYSHVNIPIVWQTTQEDLAPLRVQLQRAIDRLAAEGADW